MRRIWELPFRRKEAVGKTSCSRNQCSCSPKDSGDPYSIHICCRLSNGGNDLVWTHCTSDSTFCVLSPDLPCKSPIWWLVSIKSVPSKSERGRDQLWAFESETKGTSKTRSSKWESRKSISARLPWIISKKYWRTKDPKQGTRAHNTLLRVSPRPGKQRRFQRSC